MITPSRQNFNLFCFFISQLTFLFLVVVYKYSYLVGSNEELQIPSIHQFKNDSLVRDSKRNREEIINEGKDTISMVKNATNILTSKTPTAVDTLRNVKKSIGK